MHFVHLRRNVLPAMLKLRQGFLKLQNDSCLSSVALTLFLPDTLAFESFVVAGDRGEPVSSAKTGLQKKSISDGKQCPGMLAPKPEAGARHYVLAVFFVLVSSDK